ncbi:MAG TPA: acyl-CoA desaturase [Tepidisphaeraceae bacterium]|nr:acyl-CoA desaturase [Tepidisphaeraceae bacterium]
MESNATVSNAVHVDPARPAPSGPVDRVSSGTRVVTLLAVVLPLAGLVAAAVLLWGHGFSWLHLGLLLGAYLLTTLGITIGYHRLFTHGAFRAPRAVRVTLGVLGSMAVQGPLLRWVATHRRHHQHADDADDPHSPHFGGHGVLGVLRGWWHAHVGWLFQPDAGDLDRYVGDLRRDPALVRVSRLFVLWVALGLLIPAVIGGLVTMTWTGALLGLLWGGLARVFLVHHVTWSINSVCHLWGTRPFDSGDESRNNAVFGVLAMGEGWHNNHHAFPTSARHGLRWWQVDVSYWVIRAMSWVGLASGIKVPTADRIADKRATARAAR